MNVAAILEQLSPRKSAWIGENPPISAEKICMNPEENYRLSPRLHGQYDAVWLYEQNLFDLSSWPLLLDEALRLLGPSGKLVLRTHTTSAGTIWELKSDIFRHFAREAVLDWQITNDDGQVVSVMDITRPEYSRYTSNCWSVGILTNGVKNRNVIDLINKMADLADGEPLEFIVAGPFDPSCTICPDLVRVVGMEQWDDLPYIGWKKQLIGQAAHHENVAIFHDRYQVGDDFFTGFQKFGYDFDFVTVKQFYEDGTTLPGYVSKKHRLLRWSITGFHESPGILFDGHYISGGLMIFKKRVLQQLNFNPLLLHPEAEDCEISFHLRNIGVVPRLNVFSSAITSVPRDTYHFAPISPQPVKPIPLVKRIVDKYPGLRKRLRQKAIFSFLIRLYLRLLR